MSSRYQLTRSADSDLTEIWHHSSAQWGSKQAAKYLLELEACFIELSRHPELGRNRPEIRQGYQSISKNNHLIFYRQHHDHIEIIRILHQRMEIKDHIA